MSIKYSNLFVGGKKTRTSKQPHEFRWSRSYILQPRWCSFSIHGLSSYCKTLFRPWLVGWLGFEPSPFQMHSTTTNKCLGVQGSTTFPHPFCLPWKFSLRTWLLDEIEICTACSSSIFDGLRGAGRTGIGAVSFLARPKEIKILASRYCVSGKPVFGKPTTIPALIRQSHELQLIFRCSFFCYKNKSWARMPQEQSQFIETNCNPPPPHV